MSWDKFWAQLYAGNRLTKIWLGPEKDWALNLIWWHANSQPTYRLSHRSFCKNRSPNDTLWGGNLSSGWSFSTICTISVLKKCRMKTPVYTFSKQFSVSRMGCIVRHRTRNGRHVFQWWRHQIVTGEFPAQRVSNAELWCFLWSVPEQTVE